MLRLIMLGSGGATPYIQRTTPMLAAVVDGRTLLFDCGSGASLRLAQAGLGMATIDAIFITHFHADHCVDFPLVVLGAFLAGRQTPLPVYGPDGVHEFVTIMMDQLFPYIRSLVKNVMGADVELVVTALKDRQEVSEPRWKVTAGTASHNTPALAFRLSTTGATVAISGDTAPSEDVARLAKSVDVLIHECPFPDSIGFAPGHTLPKELGPIAAHAAPKVLVLTHLFEEVIGHEDEMIASIKTAFLGQVLLGTDLLEITVSDHVVKWRSLELTREQTAQELSRP